MCTGIDIEIQKVPYHRERSSLEDVSEITKVGRQRIGYGWSPFHGTLKKVKNSGRKSVH